MVLVDVKAPACLLPMHVAGVPIHDHREALRPSTRILPAAHSDYEEG